MPQASRAIAIDGDAIRLGSETVAPVVEVAASADAGIPSLAERLPAAALAAGVREGARGTTVTIQGDRDITPPS